MDDLWTGRTSETWFEGKLNISDWKGKIFWPIKSICILISNRCILSCSHVTSNVSINSPALFHILGNLGSIPQSWWGSTLSTTKGCCKLLLRFIEGVGYLGGSVGEVIDSWLWLSSWSWGLGIKPHFGLCTGYGVCLRFSLSLCPSPACSLFLKNKHINKSLKNSSMRVFLNVSYNFFQSFSSLCVGDDLHGFILICQTMRSRFSLLGVLFYVWFFSP